MWKIYQEKQLFSTISKLGISIDIILQATGSDTKKDITFTAAEDDAEKIVNALSQNFNGNYKIECKKDVSKISVIGSGMVNQPGVAASVFEIMDELYIDVQMVSCSEMNISLIIDKKGAVCAVQALREKFRV